jgi:alkanesulfonate monooxygenase SsuD/methylene tetrahydromethanopterin reductase-like flavin-dependent oxidoreductase (luciferase family)
MAVAGSREQARTAPGQWGPPRHQRAGASAGAFVGDPAEVADMITPFLDAGSSI